MDLSAHSLDIVNVRNFALVEYLYRDLYSKFGQLVMFEFGTRGEYIATYLLACTDMYTLFDLSKGSLPKCLRNTVRADHETLRLWWLLLLLLLWLLLVHLL